LRHLRELSGLTLQDVSRDAGVSASQICEFEKGLCGLREDKVGRIEKILLRSIRERVTRSERMLAAHEPTKADPLYVHVGAGAPGGHQ
jgi:transcriptional regulator with XRE-family HTH domain